MKIIGVNGIHSHGERSTDVLLAKLEEDGFETFDFNYPKVYWYYSRRRSLQRRHAKSLCMASTSGDAVVAHSYGCLLALRAMEQGAKFSKVFFFAPAMNVDFVFPIEGASEIFIVYCKHDAAIKWGERLLFGHDFGAMGRVGYYGPPDYRITQIEVDYKSFAHRAYFRPANLGRWVDFISGQWDPWRLVRPPE